MKVTNLFKRKMLADFEIGSVLAHSNTLVISLFENIDLNSVSDQDFEPFQTGYFGGNWLQLFPDHKELRRFVIPNFDNKVILSEGKIQLDLIKLNPTSQINESGISSMMFIGVCSSFSSIITTNFSYAMMLKCPEEAEFTEIDGNAIVKLPNINININNIMS